MGKALSELMAPAVDVYIYDARSQTSWSGQTIALPDVRDAIARLKVPLSTYGGVEITLSDTGPGVAPENVQKLFQTMFTTRKDGMGFGLSIVKTIVEMHRGRVSHEHNKQRGAIFRVWLPSIGT